MDRKHILKNLFRTRQLSTRGTCSRSSGPVSEEYKSLSPEVIPQSGTKVQEENGGHCSPSREFVYSDTVRTANKDISVGLILK